MKLKLYNTLTKKCEVFSPIDEKNVRMYVCGPTVYDRAHLGNARPAVVFDVLYRVLKMIYHKVTYVRNITDVDDKIYKASNEKKISIKELTEQTTEMYHGDIGALYVLLPDIEPKATDHIQEMIDMIKRIIDSGNGYISNGHVYFDVSSFHAYGALSHKNIEELMSGARVEISKHKKNSLDFVLWKPIDNNFDFGWDSPWGKGRPGWHIECSAMSLKYLGEIFDIHGGGIDLIFPHHENEIAQSCSVSGNEILARYWIHNGHLNMDGIKMSKSIGNFFTIHDILQRYDGEVIRLCFLMSHYTASMNFSDDSLIQAKNILDRWYTAIGGIKYIQDDVVSYDVFEAVLDDLNTPKAIMILHGLVGEINREKSTEKVKIFINTARKLLGLMNKDYGDWFRSVDEKTESWIGEMIRDRKKARASGDFLAADKIRDILLENGIVMEDDKDETSWRKISDRESQL